MYFSCISRIRKAGAPIAIKPAKVPVTGFERIMKRNINLTPLGNVDMFFEESHSSFLLYPYQVTKY